MKSRVLVLILVLLLLIGDGIVSYRVYDYLENNPTFCKSCHIMETAFASWEKSVHAMVNCHDCHHLPPREGIKLFYGFVVNRPRLKQNRKRALYLPVVANDDSHGSLPWHAHFSPMKQRRSPLYGRIYRM